MLLAVLPWRHLIDTQQSLYPRSTVALGWIQYGLYFALRWGDYCHTSANPDLKPALRAFIQFNPSEASTHQRESPTG